MSHSVDMAALAWHWNRSLPYPLPVQDDALRAAHARLLALLREAESAYIAAADQADQLPVGVVGRDGLVIYRGVGKHPADQFRQDRIAAIAEDPAAWKSIYLENNLTRIRTALDLTDGARILDLGCGIGRLLLPLAIRLPEVHFVGVDISAAMIAHGRARTTTGNVTWLVGDGRTLPDEVGVLSGAYSMITFQHIPREAQAGYIAAVAERLVPGGVFCFQVREGTAHSGLDHRVDGLWVTLACSDAGLRLDAYERVPAPLSSEICPWITATKPS